MKKTLSFRILSLLFALVLLVTALPLGIFANDVETTEEAAAVNEELTATESEGVSLLPTGHEDEPTFPEEISELRTENVKHFDKGDGTYEAIAYGGAVHRKDADGKWQDIDNTLILREDRGAERYVDADARISFAPTASSGAALWQLSENGYSISLSLADADLRAGAAADVKNHASRAEQIAAAKKADDTDALFRVDNTTKILYRNVLANVDLEYILSGNDVKETIVVQSKRENYDFSFRLSLSELIPKTTDDGAILLLDAESGKEVYLLPAPYMTDADDSYSDAVSYRLTDLGEGEYEIIVSASDEWINAPERAFPVAIDPTLTETGNTRDTYFSSTNATEKNTCHGYDSVMWLSSTEKPFIKSVNMPVLPSGATVTNAKLYFAYYYNAGVTGSMTVSAHRATRSWSEDDTWNTLSQNGTYPSLGLSSNALDVVVLSTGSSYPKWAGVNVTNAAQVWYNGTSYANYGNYGIGLNRVSGNYSVILHSREGSSYIAYYSICYRPINGVYSLLNVDTGMFLKVGNPLMSGQTSYSPSARDSLFKFAYNATDDTFIIRSMVNNEFVVYHNLSMHKPLSESATANGVTVQDEDFDGSFVWKIGTHPSYPDGSRFAIWNVSGGQNYYLAAEMTAYGCSIKFTTSVSDPGTSWNFIDENDTSMYGVESSKSDVQYMIPGETIDFDYYMYDYRVGINGPISYTVTDLNGNSTYIATINPSTGVCIAHSTGYFRVNISYPSGSVWHQAITIQDSFEGSHFIQNRQRGKYIQVDDNDAPGYNNNGGIMEIWTLDGEDFQRWQFTYLGEGFYKISSAISGLVITVPIGEEENDNVDLILTTYVGTDNQKWSIAPTTGSGVKIKAKSSFQCTDKDLVMDLETKSFFQSVNGLNVRQRKFVLNNSYNDEWILTASVMITNYYDSTFSGNNTLISNIYEANSFANTVFSELCGIKLLMQGGATQLLSASADQCNHGPNEPCSTADCGSNCSNHHKNCYKISTQLYDPSLINTIRIMWSNRDYGTYCDTENGSHHTVSWIGVVYNDRPVVQFLTLSGSTDEERAACMFLVLVHEISHTFGMPDVYDEPDHGVSGDFVCVMERFKPNYAWDYYQNILDSNSGASAFCESCEKAVICYCLGALSYD